MIEIWEIIRNRRNQIKYFLLFVLGLGAGLIIFGATFFLFGSKQVTVRSAISNISTTSNIASTCGSSSGGPTDNPIATRYGNDAYPWTENIKWNCVYNINDFNGSTMLDRFNTARDAASNNGGGVVYFPAGTYTFTDSIYLKNGVVIRGETPAVKDAKSNAYQPPTQLVFPKYEPSFSGNGTPNNTAFKKVFTDAPDSDTNIGLVNLDLNRAGINLLGNIDKTQSQNIVIFGIRSNNVGDASKQVPDLSFQEGWMRYSDRFTANININARANVLVANNRLNDAITDNYEQPGYKVKSLQGGEIITYSEGNKVPFHYGNHYGISINRSKSEGFALAADPKTEPGLFRKGIVIRDNWVFHTMRIGIQAAGDGLLIKDNYIADDPDKQWWTDPTGIKQPRGAVTYENRAIDWSGWNVTIEGNYYQVYRHRIMDTNYLSVDGEGILIQECCGGTQIKGVNISKNEGNAYIGLYKVPVMMNVRIDGNKLINNSSPNFPFIYVDANTNNRPSSMSNVVIENNVVSGGIRATATLGGSNNKIANNKGDNSGTIKYSCNIEVHNNTDFSLEPCLSVNSSTQSDR